MVEHDNPEQPQAEQGSGVDYAALLADAQQEQMTEREASPLGQTTTPESRRYEPGEDFRFLIHTTLDNPQRTFEYLGGSQSDGFRISDRPLNTSLIDSAHTATFEGASGFIIRPPEQAQDITGYRMKLSALLNPTIRANEVTGLSIPNMLI